MSSQQSRSCKVSPECIQTVKNTFYEKKSDLGLTQKAFAGRLAVSDSTVKNFLSGKAVDRESFYKISKGLGLNWLDITGTNNSLPKDTRSDSPKSLGFELPEKLPSVQFWVEGSRWQQLGRLEALLLNPEKQKIKAICILGLPGIGKTTLVNQLVRKLQDENAYFTAAAWEEFPTGMGEPPSFDTITDSLLETLSNGQITQKETAQVDYYKKTERLLKLLKDKPSLVVLDSVEVVLSTGERAGYFATDCVKYRYLFKKLTESEHQSKLIFMSREKMEELSSGVSDTIIVTGLNINEAVELLQSESFNLTATQEEFIELAERYNRHPLALSLVAAYIRDNNESHGRVERFLQDREWWLIRSIESVIDEVINRLSHQERDCLSRISVYQTQTSRLPFEGIVAQMPEVSERDLKENIIHSLKCRFLLGYDQERESYQLHPLIKEKAYNLLRQDIETTHTAHRRAAVFYRSYAGKVENTEEIGFAFAAFEQFYDADDFEQCYQVFRLLLGRENLEELRASEKLFNYTTKIIELGEKLRSELSEEKRVLVLVPLGICYSEVGKNYEALKISQELINYAAQIDRLVQEKELITFLQVAGRLIAGKANRVIGNLTAALNICEEASKISQQAKYSQGKAYALYELGTVYLEVEKSGRALRNYVIAAFLATGNSIASEIYEFSGLLSHPIEDLIPKIEKILQKYGRNTRPGTNFKMWRMLLSFGECLNQMKAYQLASFLIKKSLKCVTPTDKNPQSWSYSELALCEAGMGEHEQAKEHFNIALDLSKDLGSLVRARVLEKVGDWHYRQEQYSDSIKTFQELNALLEPTEYRLLQAKACYRLSCIYWKREQRNLTLAREYCDRALAIAEELDISLADECRELQSQLLSYQESGDE